MAKTDTQLVVMLMLMIVSSWVQSSYCLKKQAGLARKEDIPFIKCQVCETIAKQLYNQVQQKQSQIAPPKKISEYEIIEIAENLCNLKKQEADWILKIDIVEQGDKLELVEQDSEGQCNSECKTIERACQEVMENSDMDVAEYLYKKKPQLNSLINFLCKDLSDACSTKPPPVPKGRTPGEAFIPKSYKEVEMDKMLKTMEFVGYEMPLLYRHHYILTRWRYGGNGGRIMVCKGMPGAPNMKMYSRESLLNSQKVGGGDEEDEDDEDDTDGETAFRSNLQKVMLEKQSKKVDWKQKIAKGILDAGEAIKRHAAKVSFRVHKWWKRRMAGSTKKNSKSNKGEL